MNTLEIFNIADIKQTILSFLNECDGCKKYDFVDKYYIKYFMYDESNSDESKFCIKKSENLPKDSRIIFLKKVYDHYLSRYVLTYRNFCYHCMVETMINHKYGADGVIKEEDAIEYLNWEKEENLSENDKKKYIDGFY